MEVLLSIIGFVILILVLVTAHELGHYTVARLANVGILRFSIGFGRGIVRWVDKRGCEFQIGWLPLGGYVQMIDEHDHPVPDKLKPFAYNRKSPLWRIAIAGAGPAANIVLAFLVFCLIFVGTVNVRPPYIGEVLPDTPAEQAGVISGSTIESINGEEVKDYYDAVNELIRYMNDDTVIRLATDKGIFSLQVSEWIMQQGSLDLNNTLGFRFGIPAVVQDTMLNSPADQAGFLPGDKFLAMNGVGVSSYSQVADAIRANPATEVRALVNREGMEKALTLIPQRQISEAGAEYGWAGIEFDSGQQQVEYTAITVLPKAAQETWRHTVQTIELMGKLITGNMGTDSLAGPIGIAQIAGQTLTMQLESFLFVLALISIFLALINLVPLPILDGGHIMYALIEIVTRKEVSRQIRIVGNQVSMVLVFCLMIFLVYNDVSRIFAN